MKKLFLVDASSLFYRAFYAIRSLTSPSGLPTNAIYGFLSMITKILREEKPDYMVFCYDRKEPSFRKEIYPEYKAHRTETPEDLIPQIPYIKKIAHALGIPSLEMEKFEADDLIGTMAVLGRKHHLEVFIVSGDKDFAQVVGPHIWLMDTMKNQKIDSVGVKEKWGIEPNQMIDYLALVGDSSDNVPGVDGIGPKGAQKLIQEFGTLEKIYENLDQIKGSLHEKLKSQKNNAFLSKKLVTIITDAPIATELQAYHVKPIQADEFKDMMKELNFKNFDRILDVLPSISSQHQENQSQSANQNKVQKTFSDNGNEEQHNTTTHMELDRKKTSASQIAHIELNFETNDLHVENLSHAIKKHDEVFAFLTDHGVFLGHSISQTLFVLKGESQNFGEHLARLDLKWRGFDLKKFWHAVNFKIQNKAAVQVVWDSMIAAYVIKAGENVEFDHLCSRFAGEFPSDLNLPQEIYIRQLKLQSSLHEKVTEIHADKVLNEIELPLIPILYQIEKMGITLDIDVLKEQNKELSHELRQAEQSIIELAGEKFNIASPKQLAHILFEKLQLPVGKKIKTGYSTDTDVLEKLKAVHPIAELILQFREIAKLKSTYIEALPFLVKEDGRIHTTLNQALTTTGRLSSTEPNLQNIPIRTERGARIRKAFVAERGKRLLSVDYSQIELRILAHYSEDKNLCQAFRDDLDIHIATAAEVFSVALDKVTTDMRRTAKAVNFGIAYGQGAFGLAENLGISRTEASEIIKKYFARFPGVQNYIQETIRIAQDKGYVETLYGRRRYLDDIKSNSPALKKFAERAAINAPIQGTASDIVKLAMIKVAEKISAPMILQIHDELLFEASESELLENKSAIIEVMENVTKLSVPLKVNAAIGPNWDEAH